MGSETVKVPRVLIVIIGILGDAFSEKMQVWMFREFAFDKCRICRRAVGTRQVPPEHGGQRKICPQDRDIVRSSEGAKFVEIHLVIRMDRNRRAKYGREEFF